MTDSTSFFFVIEEEEEEVNHYKNDIYSLLQNGNDAHSNQQLQQTLDREELQEILQHLVFNQQNIHQLGWKNLLRQVREKIFQIQNDIPSCLVELHDLSVSIDKSKAILQNINAEFQPSSMTLIMGPPGCGKTTLLKAIAGILPVKQKLIQGAITYNKVLGKQLDLAKLVTYVDQHDEHIPILTVKETLDFAHKCQIGVLDSDDPLAVNEQNKVGILLAILGLEQCANTIVGNNSVRGISGGQRRRVTVGEMLTGNASCILMDEYSTGLDSLTTYDITQSLKTMTTLLKKTCVVSMLQPPPEVYDLFDNILVLYDGKIVYHGDRPSLPKYFESVGYRCPEGKDIAEFIQEVTSSFRSKFDFDSPCVNNGHKRPQNADEFAELFEDSVYRKHTISTDVDHEMLTSSLIENIPIKKKYALTWWQSVKVIGGREMKILTSNKFFLYAKIFESVIVGLVIGSLFYRLPDTIDFVAIKISLLFLALLLEALSTTIILDNAIGFRNIIYRQSSFKFYSETVYAVVESSVQFFWMFVQILFYGPSIYWLVGLSSGWIHFVIFLSYIWLLCVVYCQLFKLYSAIIFDAILVKVVAISTIFLGQIFSGYIVPEDNIPIWWQWFFWINPMSWAFRGIVQNEFLSKKDSYELVLNGKRTGDIFLEVIGVSSESSYIIFGILILIIQYLIYLVLTIWAYKNVRLRPPQSKVTPLNETKRFSSMLTEDCYHGINEVELTVTPKTNNLPFIPVTISFSNLSYSVPGKGSTSHSRTMLLNDLHGYFKPGSLTALMGSSGAGKTTLLDVIAGRKTTGDIEGQIFVNGYHPLNRGAFNSVTGYVEQNDLHLETSTVLEALNFSAYLRLPRNLSNQMRDDFIDETLHVLELSSKAHEFVSCLSLGEKKRLTIGVELLSNPSVLFLDEPTSGLDSRAAMLVVECIQRIARSGRTVVCTIHQPSIQLFECFDQLMLLQTGGKLAYFGSLGRECADLINFFHQINDVPRIGKGVNPASYMLDCIESRENQSAIDFPEVYIESRVGTKNMDEILTLSATKGEVLSNAQRYEVTHRTQYLLLFQRSYTNYKRSHGFLISRLVASIFLAICLGSIYRGKSVASSLDVISRISLIYFGCTAIAAICAIPIVSFTFRDRPVYYRERASRMYSAHAYYLTLFAIECIYTLFLAAIFVNIFYWLVGLNFSTTAWLWFWLINTLNMVTLAACTHTLAFGIQNIETALVVAGILVNICLIFSGVLISEAKMPNAWKFLYWISPMHYAFEAIFSTQFFLSKDIQVFNIQQNVVSSVADVAMDYLGGSFHYSNRFFDISILLLWFLGAISGSLLAVQFLNHQKR